MVQGKPAPVAERVRQLLDYDPSTGMFRWRVKPSKRIGIGAVAGSLSSDGHRRIEINRVRYQAHHLAWLLTYGEWPTSVIDHANGDPDDNRIGNLRAATNAQNMQNCRRFSTNSSGFKGVTFCHQTRRWRAHIVVDGRYLHLGWFSSPEEAHAAYVAAAIEHFGEFARAA
jgi:hypothetical protein